MRILGNCHGLGARLTIANNIEQCDKATGRLTVRNNYKKKASNCMAVGSVKDDNNS